MNVVLANGKGWEVSGENEGLLFLSTSSNEVTDKTRGGRIPFCGSAVLSTRMSRVHLVAGEASNALAMRSSIIIVSARKFVTFG